GPGARHREGKAILRPVTRSSSSRVGRLPEAAPSLVSFVLILCRVTHCHERLCPFQVGFADLERLLSEAMGLLRSELAPRVRRCGKEVPGCARPQVSERVRTTTLSGHPIRLERVVCEKLYELQTTFARGLLDPACDRGV